MFHNMRRAVKSLRFVCQCCDRDSVKWYQTLFLFLPRHKVGLHFPPLLAVRWGDMTEAPPLECGQDCVSLSILASKNFPENLPGWLPSSVCQLDSLDSVENCGIIEEYQSHKTERVQISERYRSEQPALLTTINDCHASWDEQEISFY